MPSARTRRAGAFCKAVIRRVARSGGSNPFSGAVRHNRAMHHSLITAVPLMLLAITSFAFAVWIVVAKQRRATWTPVPARVVSAWTHFAVVHPLNAASRTVDDYWELIDAAPTTRP